MKRLHLILFFICFLAACSFAQSNAYWNEIPGPYGGDFKLVQTPGDILYAVHPTNWKATYRSVDQGATWQQLTFLQDFQPDKQDRRVFVGEGGTIFMRLITEFNNLYYRTNNDGQTWVSTAAFPYAFIENADKTLVGISGTELKRSTNGGQTWTTVLSPQGSSDYFYDLKTTLTGEVYVQFHHFEFTNHFEYLCRSADGGQTWSQTEVSTDYRRFHLTPSGIIFGFTTSKIYRSIDGGNTFDLSNNYLPSESMIELQSGRILLQANGILSSDDQGASWANLNGENSGSGMLVSDVRLSDNKIFKIRVQDAVIASIDGGQNWNYAAMGLRAAKVEQIHFVSDSVLYAYAPGGLWKTSDAGANWQLLQEIYGYRQKGHYFDVSDAGGVGVMAGNRLMWAADGSQFNDISPTDLIHPQYNVFWIHPLTGDFYLGAHTGLKKSSNQGQSWETVLNQYLITGIEIHPSGALIAANYSDDLFVSDPSGQNWQEVVPPPVTAVRSSHVSKDGVLYISDYVGNNDTKLWKSTNLGASWVLTPSVINGIDPLIQSAPNGYLVHADYFNGLFLSVNQANTWQNMPHPLYTAVLEQSTELVASLSVSETRYLFAGTVGHGLWKSNQPLDQGSVIKGKIQVDADSECSTPDAQEGVPNRIVLAESADFTYYSNTDTDGNYVFLVDTGFYNLTSNTPNNLWWSYCDASQEINVPAYFTTDSVDFIALALADCPLISVEVGVPFLRRCFNNEVFVQYCNQGAQPADSAWIDVILDPYMSFVASTQPHTVQGNNIVRFFVGDVPSGDCRQFQLTAYINCDSTVLGQTHCITAHGFPDTVCFTVSNWSGAEIQASVACQDTLVLFKLQNVGDAPSQILDYIIIEDDVVMFQGSQNYIPDEFLEIPISANGHTYRIESEQEPGHPFSTLALAFQEGCGGYESLGYINQFAVNGRTPSWHTKCEENSGSYDPNDKHGYPIGVGEDHRILPGQPVDYRIRFQNTGTDTAFTVVIRDTLSALLDPSTLTMGASSHHYIWQLEGAGILKITFNNINLPDSNVNWVNSQGFVQFRIAQKPDLPLGTQIFNKAGIYFDFNAPVMTNETWHTIGFPDVVDAEEPTLETQGRVLVTPNPAEQVAHFKVVSDQNHPYFLQLYSPLGMVVSQHTLENNHLEIPRRNLPAGAYRWILKSSTGEPVEGGVLIFK